VYDDVPFETRFQKEEEDGYSRKAEIKARQSASLVQVGKKEEEHQSSLKLVLYPSLVRLLYQCRVMGKGLLT